MKKFFIFFFFSIITTLSIAGNSYCDSKKTPTEIQRCYANAVQMQNYQINSIVQSIYASEKLSDMDKKQLSDDMQDWVKWVNDICQNNVCMYNQMTKMKKKINLYYEKYAK